jgi:hypothetical protein
LRIATSSWLSAATTCAGSRCRVRQTNFYFLGPVNDMLRGQDIALRIDDEPGTAAALRLGLDAFRFLSRDADLHDGRARAVCEIHQSAVEPVQFRFVAESGSASRQTAWNAFARYLLCRRRRS